MFPTIKQLSVRQIYNNGTANRQGHTGRTVCVALWSYCAVSFLFILNRTFALCPILFQCFRDEDGLKSVLWVFQCVWYWGNGQFSLTTEPAAYPPAGFAVSSAKKNSTGFRPGEAISCCLIELCMCVRECLQVCGLACRCTLCFYTIQINITTYVCGEVDKKSVSLHASVNRSVRVKTPCIYVR